jgi:nitrite reductase (NADH) small subunit
LNNNFKDYPNIILKTGPMNIDEALLSNTAIRVKTWFKAVRTEDVPENNGVTIKYEDKQIAVFNFTDKGKWFATQNLCPHKFEMVLSRGIIGDAKGEPKLACPIHKKTFSLESGECLNGDPYKIDTYPVKIEGGYVLIGIPF